MKSPFPGMDPYLEAQGRWRDLHTSMITYCRDALNEVLPENYIAQIEEQIRLVSPEAVVGVLYPDVLLGRDPKPTTRAPARPSGASPTTLQPVTIPLLKGDVEEIHDTWIEIRNLPELDLVTVIELLSPTNKTGVGRVEYLDKRDQYIDLPVNLVELDLLVGGRRLPMKKPMPPGDYYALVARAQQRPDCDVYTWSIREPLPTIPIPLKLLDSDVMLNVDDPFALAYQRGRYVRTIDYSRPLDLPLGPKDKVWAEQIAASAIERTAS
jgi:Protein of unknown function (DUF4058)